MKYLHGIEIIEMPGTPSINSVDSCIIGIVAVLKPPEETSVFPSATEIFPVNAANNKETQKKEEEEKKKKKQVAYYMEPYLITSLNDFNKHFTDCTGELVEALEDIYSQMPTYVVVAPIKAATDFESGIKLLEKAPAKLNKDPKILVAPGLAKDKDSVDKLVALAKKLKAVALVDLEVTQPNGKASTPPDNTTEPNTSTPKEAAKQLTQSDRLYLLYPKIKIKRDNVEKIRPASPFVAGILAKSDIERGFWFSPSNYKVSGIIGLENEIDFTFGDTECLANQLNSNNITTFIWQGGYRLWGNRSYITEGPEKNFEFLSVRRTADILNTTLQKHHLWAIDQAITKNLKDTIVDSVNTYMRALKLQGAIINGKCWADSEKNTKESLADGQLYINFDFTAPYPAERITFQSFLTKEYLSEVLA